MANERLLQLLSDVVQSNIQTENRISQRLTTLVSQSAGRSPRSETGGGDNGGHTRDTVDGKASGDDAAAGGIIDTITPRVKSYISEYFFQCKLSGATRLCLQPTFDMCEVSKVGL